MTAPADDAGPVGPVGPFGPTAGSAGRSTARQAFSALMVGVRVVVRYRIEGGATDVLGFLTRISDSECDVRTRHGTVTVTVADIIAAKPIPPEPPRRPRR